MNEHVSLLKAYLDELCDHIEHRERATSWPNWRKRAIAAATPFAVGIAVVSCDADMEHKDTPTKECTSSDCATLCEDGVDNDEDGKIDCNDTDCAAASVCGSTPVYSAPLAESDCSDGVDNDADGDIDCADTDCANAIACTSTPEYAVAMEVCNDKIDNDGNGAIDCADATCADDAACAGAVVETDCSDGIDNDGDGAIDCADADDCSCGIPIYSVFMK